MQNYIYNAYQYYVLTSKRLRQMAGQYKITLEELNQISAHITDDEDEACYMNLVDQYNEE
jgi:hypothetical protein